MSQMTQKMIKMTVNRMTMRLMARTETSRINGSLPPLSASSTLLKRQSKRKISRLLERLSYVNLKRNGGYRATSKLSNEASNSRKNKLRSKLRRSGT